MQQRPYIFPYSYICFLPFQLEVDEVGPYKGTDAIEDSDEGNTRNLNQITSVKWGTECEVIITYKQQQQNLMFKFKIKTDNGTREEIDYGSLIHFFYNILSLT